MIGRIEGEQTVEDIDVPAGKEATVVRDRLKRVADKHGHCNRDVTGQKGLAYGEQGAMRQRLERAKNCNSAGDERCRTRLGTSGISKFNPPWQFARD
ncbi:MAG: hypothetical protein MUC44_00310 [Beijerinckiaceae bacterium]|nr:hypothetical protein [Beijerinckiaceae bacterium]